MKNPNKYLNLLMIGFFGVFVGRVLATYLDYRRDAESFADRPKPWYYYALQPAVYVLIGAVAACTAVKLALCRDKDSD